MARITQLSYFEGKQKKLHYFWRKHGFKPYRNPRAATVFFGMRHMPQQHRLARHKGLAVCLWQGPAARQGQAKHAVFHRANVRHVARSHWVEKDLAAAGLEYKRLNLSPVRLDDLVAEPLGDEVYVYMPRGWQAAHGKKLVDEVMQQCPSVRFFLNEKTVLSRAELIPVYRRTLVGLRMSAHDGFGNTVAELGYMGRRIIWNGDAPNAVPWTGVQDAVEAITAEMASVGETRADVAEQMHGWVHEDRDWLQTGYWL